MIYCLSGLKLGYLNKSNCGKSKMITVRTKTIELSWKATPTLFGDFSLPRSRQAYESLLLCPICGCACGCASGYAAIPKLKTITAKHQTLAMMETLSPQFPFAQCGRPPREFLLLFIYLQLTNCCPYMMNDAFREIA